MEKETARFDAISKDGIIYTVIEYQQRIQFRMLEGTRWGAGMKRLALTDGQPVNPTGDPDRFLILETGEGIRRIVD